MTGSLTSAPELDPAYEGSEDLLVAAAPLTDSQDQTVLSPDASTEETIGILFEGEFVPEPPLPTHQWESAKTPVTATNSNKPQTTGMRAGHLGTAEGCGWTANGPQAVSLCYVLFGCFVTRAFGFGGGSPDLSIDPCPATLVMASWVVTSVTNHTHLANVGLCQTHVRN